MKEYKPKQERTHKQVIVVRKDLNMRKGKIAAQAAHASMAALLNNSRYTEDDHLMLKLTDKIKPWLEAGFTKVVVSVDSEEELLAVHQKCVDSSVITALIQDSGFTEFNGVPTYTAVAVGPDEHAVIDTITGGLKLL